MMACLMVGGGRVSGYISVHLQSIPFCACFRLELKIFLCVVRRVVWGMGGLSVVCWQIDSSLEESTYQSAYLLMPAAHILPTVEDLFAQLAPAPYAFHIGYKTQ